jgi:hypothetical protein
MKLGPESKHGKLQCMLLSNSQAVSQDGMENTVVSQTSCLSIEKGWVVKKGRGGKK